VAQNIGRGGCGVPRDNQPVENNYLAECGRDGFEQLKDPAILALNRGDASAI
jgi:hypothetical protein